MTRCEHDLVRQGHAAAESYLVGIVLCPRDLYKVDVVSGRGSAVLDGVPLGRVKILVVP